MAEFVAWGKTPRWNREVVITEKIDGTNGAIIIEDVNETKVVDGTLGVDPDCLAVVAIEADLADHYHYFEVYAQSRKRLITSTKDNFGFAAWVQENAETLVRDLGPGRHYGEWYGKGIQRGYGLDHRRFALFNTSKWADAEFETEHLSTVPVLDIHVVPDTWLIEDSLDYLRKAGSQAVPGYMNPEGIVIFHTAANSCFKILLENDEGYKGEAA